MIFENVEVVGTAEIRAGGVCTFADCHFGADLEIQDLYRSHIRMEASSVAGTTLIETGYWWDTAVTLDSAEFGGAVTITGSTESDSVLVRNECYFSDSLTFQESPWASDDGADSVQFTSGNGNYAAIVKQSLKIATGDGADVVDIEDTHVGIYCHIDTGAGEDVIEWKSSSCDGFWFIQMWEDKDWLCVSDSIFYGDIEADGGSYPWDYAWSFNNTFKGSAPLVLNFEAGNW